MARCWQVADAQEMLFGWRGALAVTLNAAWDPEQVDPDLKSFVKAFDAIYVFQPLSIQVRAPAVLVPAENVLAVLEPGESARNQVSHRVLFAGQVHCSGLTARTGRTIRCFCAPC